jgi:CubicO group peptidase (beta-lactamase class C family)
VWGGEQIVSKDWLDEMTSAKVPPDETPFADVAFGYLWWKEINRNVSFSMGHGGQCILLNKDKNLMIVITSERHTGGRHNLSVEDACSIFDMINRITE